MLIDVLYGFGDGQLAYASMRVYQNDAHDANLDDTCV